MEQVSKFNSTNQNVCSDAGTYPLGVFSDREIIQRTIPTQDSKSTRKYFACTNSDSNILATVEKADRVFWRRIALHLRIFMKNKIDSHPDNVRS